MDSKRDIRPKLASRLLKDSLVLHCLFRVSLATQHIIGTIIFLKQRKTRIRVTFFESMRARPVQRDDCARTLTACYSATHAGFTAYRHSGLRRPLFSRIRF